jgi:hypothetical protein
MNQKQPSFLTKQEQRALDLARRSRVVEDPKTVEIIDALVLAQASRRGDKMITGDSVTEHAVRIVDMLVEHPRLNEHPAFGLTSEVKIIEKDGPKINGDGPLVKLLNAVLGDPGVAAGVATVHARRNVERARAQGCDQATLAARFAYFMTPVRSATKSEAADRIAKLRLGTAFDSTSQRALRDVPISEKAINATRTRMEQARLTIQTVKDALPSDRSFGELTKPLEVDAETLLPAVRDVIVLGLSVQEDGRFVLQGREGLSYSDVRYVNEFLRPEGVQTEILHELNHLRKVQAALDWTGSMYFSPSWALRPAHPDGVRLVDSDRMAFPDIELPQHEVHEVTLAKTLPELGLLS